MSFRESTTKRHLSPVLRLKADWRLARACPDQMSQGGSDRRASHGSGAPGIDPVR